MPSDATSGPITINTIEGFRVVTIVHDNTAPETESNVHKDFNRDGQKDVHDHFLFVSITGLEPERLAPGREMTLSGTGFTTIPRTSASVLVFFNDPLPEACFQPSPFCAVESSLTTDGTSVTFYGA